MRAPSLRAVLAHFGGCGHVFGGFAIFRQLWARSGAFATFRRFQDSFGGFGCFGGFGGFGGFGSIWGDSVAMGQSGRLAWVGTDGGDGVTLWVHQRGYSIAAPTSAAIQ